MDFPLIGFINIYQMLFLVQDLVLVYAVILYLTRTIFCDTDFLKLLLPKLSPKWYFTICSFLAQYYACFQARIACHSTWFQLLYLVWKRKRHKPFGHFIFFHLGISSLRSSKHSFVEFLCTNAHKIIKYRIMICFLLCNTFFGSS